MKLGRVEGGIVDFECLCLTDGRFRKQGDAIGNGHDAVTVSGVYFEGGFEVTEDAIVLAGLSQLNGNCSHFCVFGLGCDLST